ncbi:MAG: DDE-type integrase/transposase/recombinase [Crocinitomicaceae bacterium]|nr:DDE-type integrase/transposase/recombinase [Crocinitomicaceae bacterium]
MQRQTYHTTLKELAHYGILPEKYQKMIPRTNLHRWKNDSFERYVGSEINQIADKHSELIKLLNEYPKMFHAYGEVVKTIVKIVKTQQTYVRLMREAKEDVVKVIEQIRDIIPINKAVELFKISSTTYAVWKNDVLLACKESFFEKCNRIYPTQIIPKEILNIKKEINNPAVAHWRLNSIYHNGFRKGKITVSLNTFYKINKRFGFRKSDKQYLLKKRRRKICIRAQAPNQIWHTDITIVKTLDKKKYYVYLLIDNFSRKLLAYDIKEKVSGLITQKLIETAVKVTSKVTDSLNVKLIVDGGPENNNTHVDNFIKNSKVNIQKLVALKDIDFSNSMIENTNRVLKYHYIFPEHPKNYNDLIEQIVFFDYDFNSLRPHGQLKGLTPDEAFEGKQIPKDFRTKILKQARIDRIEYNKKNRCEQCK